MACRICDIKLPFQSLPHPSSCPSADESGCRTLKKKKKNGPLLYYSGGSGQILECGWLLTDPTPRVNVNVCVCESRNAAMTRQHFSLAMETMSTHGWRWGLKDQEREWDRGVHNLILGRRYLWPPPPLLQKSLSCVVTFSLSHTHMRACKKK